MNNTYFYGYNIAQNSTVLFEMRSLKQRWLPRGYYIGSLENQDYIGKGSEQDELCFDICSSFQTILEAKNELDSGNGTQLHWFLASAVQHVSFEFSEDSGVLTNAQYVLYALAETEVMIDTAAESYLGFLNGVCTCRIPYDEKMSRNYNDIARKMWENVRASRCYRAHDLGDGRSIAYIK